MEQSAQLALKNRTGLQMSPTQSKELLETLKGVNGLTAPPSGDGRALAEMRSAYCAEAEPLGSVPAPTSLKGMAKSGATMLTGKRPQVLIDKLAERAAFERGGTRLYDGILAKLQAQSRAAASGIDLPQDLTVGTLREIRDQEAQHFRLIAECTEQLGSDPTVQTPGADLVGVQSAGLIQSVSDPRTTLVQSLHAALAAELIDNDGWELLIKLAQEMGDTPMVSRFEDALREEGDHLRRVRGWYQQLTLAEGGVS